MTPAPPLSVVMSVFQGERFLRGSLESVLVQSHTDFECIVVDDGSTDGSAEILQDAARRDPRVRVLTNERNLGLGASLNRGVEAARGDLIARMDADDLALPSRFARQVEFLSTHSEICVAATEFDFIDQDGRYLATPYRPSARLAKFMALNQIFHSSVMIRTDCVKKAGGYDPRLRHGIDKDLWKRMVRAGCRIAIQPERLCRRRVWSETMTISRVSQGERRDHRDRAARRWVAALLSRHGEPERARQLWQEILAESGGLVPAAWGYLLISYLPRPIQNLLLWEIRIRLRHYAAKVARVGQEE